MATKVTTFSLPTSLKLSHLKTIAQKCGLQTTGTKSALLSRLHHEITSPAKLVPGRSTRVLSIDMGIRNLAYCVLNVPSTKASKSKDEPIDGMNMPVLEAWHRLAVSSKPEVVDGATAPVKEAFDPATLSEIAYDLLKHRLLVSSPDIILIERQRFRSMGSKHILEWTIRVNMFESILYATLHTLKAEGLWSGTVIPIAPGKVGPFWVGEESDFLDVDEIEGRNKKKIRTSKSAKIRNKGAKVDLVRGWCENGQVVCWGSSQVEEMARRYQEKWDAKPGRMKSKIDRQVQLIKNEEVEKVGKLDDLADCLLQSMAWVEWEKNKKLVLERGHQVLLDSL